MAVFTTTRQASGAKSAPDLLERNFAVAQHAHEVWVSDITYLWTREGWLYLAVILDLFSRAVVGWSTGTRLNAELVVTAFMRASSRFLPGCSAGGEVIFHSDRGSQYTSSHFRHALSNQPDLIRLSSGLSCYDSAVMESFFHSLKDRARSP